MKQLASWILCVLLMADTIQFNEAQAQAGTGKSELDSVKDDITLLEEKNDDLVTHILYQMKSMDEKLGWCIVDERQTNVHQALLKSNEMLKANMNTMKDDDSVAKRDIYELKRGLSTLTINVNAMMSAQRQTEAKLNNVHQALLKSNEVLRANMNTMKHDDNVAKQDIYKLKSGLSAMMTAQRQIKEKLEAILRNMSPARLVGGRRSGEGRLEVFHNGQWGTVCNDRFWFGDATAVCRMLGFSSGSNDKTVAADGTGQIWLDDMDCPSEITSIDQCEHSGWGVHDCGHDEDVRLKCT